MKKSVIAIISLCAITAGTAAISIGASATDYATGDITGDSIVDISDIKVLQDWLLKKDVHMENPLEGDINGDGKVNIFDLALLKRKVINIRDRERNSEVYESVNKALLATTNAYDEDYGFTLKANEILDTEKEDDILDVGFMTVGLNKPRQNMLVNYSDSDLARDIQGGNMVPNNTLDLTDGEGVQKVYIEQELPMVMDYLVYQDNDVLAGKKLRLAVYSVTVDDKKEVEKIEYKYVYLKIPKRDNYNAIKVIDVITNFKDYANGEVVSLEFGEDRKIVYGSPYIHNGVVMSCDYDNIGGVNMDIVSKGLHNLDINEETGKRVIDENTKTIIVYPDNSAFSYGFRQTHDRVINVLEKLAQAVDDGDSSRIYGRENNLISVANGMDEVEAVNFDSDTDRVTIKFTEDSKLEGCYIDFTDLTIHYNAAKIFVMPHESELYNNIIQAQEDIKSSMKNFMTDDDYINASNEEKAHMIFEAFETINENNATDIDLITDYYYNDGEGTGCFEKTVIYKIAGLIDTIEIG